MSCKVCEEKIAELEMENKKLRLQLRQLKNKLYNKTREVNRRHRDDFESVDFGYER